jgi:replicative DNA helicase
MRVAEVHYLHGQNSAPRPAPLHNVEAEQAILGAALVNNAVVRRTAFLSAGDFFEPVHGRIWSRLCADVEAGRLSDPVSLGMWFETEPALVDMGGRKYLADLGARAESIVNAVEYARTVRDASRRRRLAEAARAMAERADNRADNADAAVIWAEMGGALEAAARDDAKSLGKSLFDLASDISDEMLNPREMLSTGIASLDEAAGGGIPYGYIVGFEARPAGFKSGTLHTIAVNVAKAGVPCCYFAAEMGRMRLAKRMMGHLGAFKSQRFRYPSASLISDIARVAPKLPKELAIEDCPGITFSQLKQLASEHLTRRKCQVFFLDYYQLVTPDGRCDSRSQHLEEVAYWLQSFASKHDATWFIASQQNRDGHTLGSDGLMRACDWLARIHKEETKFLHPELGAVTTIWMDVAKSRDGMGDPIGETDQPAFFIHPHGPHLAEL